MGVGKACVNYLNLFVMLEGDEIPYVLRCPPTSLSKRGPLLTFLTYAPSEAKKATGTKAYQLIVTEFTLKRQPFASGISSVVVPRKVGVLDVEKDAARIETLMFWYRRIRDEWETGRARGAKVPQGIENADAESEAAKDEVAEAGECTGTGVSNPDWVGANPAPVAEDDAIPF